MRLRAQLVTFVWVGLGLLASCGGSNSTGSIAPAGTRDGSLGASSSGAGSSGAGSSGGPASSSGGDDLVAACGQLEGGCSPNTTRTPGHDCALV